MEFIVLNINSDLDPVTYPIDTDSEIQEAQDALRDAGLEYAAIWYGDGPDDVDAYADSVRKLFASKSHD